VRKLIIRPKFIRNISESLGIASANAFKDMVPSIRSTMSSNKNYVAQAYSTTRERLNPEDIRRTQVYKSGEEMIKNAISDLKSGKLYNAERAKKGQEQMMKDMGLDFSALEDMDKMDISGDVNNTVNQNIIMNDGSTGEVIEGSIGKLTNLTASAMKMNNTGTSAISRQMSMIISQQGNANRFYEDTSSKLADMTASLTQMNGYLGVLAEVSVGGNRNNNLSQSPLQALLGLEGGTDIQGLKGLYAKKYNAGGNSYLMEMMKPLITEFVANPIGTVLKEGMKLATPRAFKSALGELDQIHKLLPVMMQGRFADWKDSDNVFKKNAAKIFGIDLSEQNRNLDFSNYEKGRVSFDGITRRSIVNVIPSLLSKILTAVSRNPVHQEELVYDYEKGQFTTRKRVLDGIERNVKDFNINSFDVAKYKEQMVDDNKDKFDSDEELKKFMDRIDDVLMESIKKTTLINGNTKAGDLSEDTEAAQAIIDVFNKQKGIDKAQFQKDLLEASNSYYEGFRRLQSEESMNNVLDIEREDSYLNEDYNKRIARRNREKNLYEDRFGVENNMSKKNPFYWMTEALRGSSRKITDFTMDDEIPNTPEGVKNGYNSFKKKFSGAVDSVKKKTESFTQGDNFATRGAKRASEAFRRTAEDIDTRSSFNSNYTPDYEFFSFGKDKEMKSQEDLTQAVGGLKEEIGSDKGVNKSIIKLTEVIKETLPAKNSSNDSSRASSSASTERSNTDLSILPKINDNILHIIALLESKFSADGLPLERTGKFKDHITRYKDKTLGFFDRLFVRGDSKNRNVLTPLSRMKKRGMDFFSSIFGKDKEKDQKVDEKQGQGFLSRLFGSEGMITVLGSKIMEKAGGLLSNRGPIILDFAKKMAFSFLEFGKKVLGGATTVAGSLMKTIGEKLSQRREGREDRRQERRNNRGQMLSSFKDTAMNLFSLPGKLLKGRRGNQDELENPRGKRNGVLRNAFESIGRALGLKKESTQRLLSQAKENFPSLTGGDRKKEVGEVSKKRKLTTPDMLDMVLTTGKKDSLNVIVSGGHLDGIRETVKVRTLTPDEKSAESQIAKFKEQSALRRANRKGHVSSRRGRRRASGAQDEEGNSLTSMVASGLGSIGTEVLGEVIGNKLSGGGAEMDGPNDGRMSRRERRANRRKGLGRFFGRGGNSATKSGRGMMGKLGGLKNLLGRGGRMGIVAGGGLLGGSMLGAGSAEAAETTGKVAGEATETAAKGAKAGGLMSGLGKGARAVGRGLKFVPGLGLIATAGMGVLDGVNGAKAAGDIFNTDDATFGQKASATAGGILSGLSFGLLDRDKMSKGIHGAGSWVKDKASGVGNFMKENSTALLAGGGVLGAGALGLKKMQDREEERKKDRESSKGENSKDPIVRTATWVEKLGKFFSVGAGASFFGGIIGAITGKSVGGIFGKVGDFFKGLFGGNKEESSSGGGGGEYTGKIGDGIGALSHKYESGGDPGTVANNAGDIGGQSFGSYQFARNTGSLKSFINSLGSMGHQDWEDRLNAAYNSQSESAAVWKAIAKEDPEGFGKAQDEYIANIYYKPVAQKLKTQLGFDIASRPVAVQAALLSTAVQHGQGGAYSVWSAALGKNGSNMSDADVINAVYNERAANNGMKYFPSSSASIRASVVKRFGNEKKDALAMLSKGGGSTKTASEDTSKSDSGSGSSAEAKNNNNGSRVVDDPFADSEYSGGYSTGDSSYSGAAKSNYNSLSPSFQKIASGIASSLSPGAAYVGNMTSTADLRQGTSGWNISNPSSVASKSSSASGSLNVANVNNLSELATANSTNNSITSILPTLSDLTKSSNNVVNNNVSNMNKNLEQVAEIQDILSQINETGRKGNDTLGEMLGILMDIRDNARRTVASSGGSSSGSFSSSRTLTPMSNELQSVREGY
jgi:hypothetical protein